MIYWRKFEKIWCTWPSKPIGVIEMIGGSYLASNPQISYRRLLEALTSQGFAIHAWSYLPLFDHQTQANKAWKNFRECKNNLEIRIGEKLPKPIRIGHSLGCKLHLLAPDGGRNCEGLIALSFNNFAANSSIPIVSKVSKKLGFHTEFNPSPKETMRLIIERYIQSKNLLIRFSEDNLDQSFSLLDCLQKRKNDNSTIIQLEGNHLTPASAGLRQNLPGNWPDDLFKTKNLKALVSTITKWSY